MGKSPSIQDLESKDDEFRAYLQQLQTQLGQQSGGLDGELAAKINDFYTANHYTDAQDLVTGQNYDFIRDQEFSLANLKSMVDAISAAVFAGGATPPGSEVDSGGQQAAAATLGPEVGEMADLELYMAGQVFDALTTTVLGFGTSTAIAFDSEVQTTSLGYGLELFTVVTAESYQSFSFFNGDYIYVYLYDYDVRFSAQQAHAESSQSLITRYQDQIAAFRQRQQDLQSQLDSGTISLAAFTSADEVYQALIDADEAKVAGLRAEAATTATPPQPAG